LGDFTNTNYLLSQIAVVACFGFFAFTYFCKRKESKLIFDVISCSFLALSYFLLNAWVGFGAICVEIARDIVYLFIEKRHKTEDTKKKTRLDYYMLAFWLSALVFVTFFTQEGWLTWFGMASSFLFTISISQKSDLVYKIMGGFIAIVAIVYNVLILSIFGIIMESFILLCAIIGLCKSRKIKK
jgi:hypothetical protein